MEDFINRLDSGDIVATICFVAAFLMGGYIATLIYLGSCRSAAMHERMAKVGLVRNPDGQWVQAKREAVSVPTVSLSASRSIDPPDDQAAGVTR